MNEKSRIFENKDEFVGALKVCGFYDAAAKLAESRAIVDFHFHTDRSDGSESVASMIKVAKWFGSKALALTDHNTGKGVPEFMAAAKEAGIRALEGTEIFIAFPKTCWSWDMSKCGPVPDATILGRQLNWTIFVNNYERQLRDYWVNTWLPETLEKLRALGFKVPGLTKKEIEEQVDIGVPPVLHEVPKNSENLNQLLKICREFEPAYTKEDLIANPVAGANRYVYSIQGGAYVLRGPQEFGVAEGVDLAKRMGGVLFAAHPGGNYANWSDKHLNYFIQQGGGGIEVWQYYHRPEQIGKFLKLVGQYDLLISGGSDWHGANGKATLGCWDKPENQTPLWVADQLFEKLP